MGMTQIMVLDKKQNYDLGLKNDEMLFIPFVFVAASFFCWGLKTDGFVTTSGSVVVFDFRLPRNISS